MLINFQLPRSPRSCARSTSCPPPSRWPPRRSIWRYLYEPRLRAPQLRVLAAVGVTPPPRASSSPRAGRCRASTSSCIWTTPADRDPPLPGRAPAHPGLGDRGRDARRRRLVRRVRYIIWPGVRYMTLLVAIISLLAFTNGAFDLVNILTKGRPIYGTQTLIYYIYRQRVQLRRVRLRRGAVGAADRAHRRDPRRARRARVRW